MGTQKYKVFILMGANLGPCVETFRKARVLIEKKVGTVLKGSKIYNSLSWGFESEDVFYNQAFLIETSMAPFATMEALLAIEKELGRQRAESLQNAESLQGAEGRELAESLQNAEGLHGTGPQRAEQRNAEQQKTEQQQKTEPKEAAEDYTNVGSTYEKKYASRIIDIDILFFEDFVIQSPLLTVPHPRFKERRFALIPMCEIAPQWQDPQTKKSMEDLLQLCPDKSVITSPDLPPIESSNMGFIAIEGNIGSGKTSLSSRIANDYGAKLVLESFEENVFLPKFYNNQERYAFPLELTFLAERYRQAKEEFVPELFAPFIVSDFVISKSLVFAKKTLNNDEFGLFSRLYKIILSTVPKPDLYVYLHSSPKHLKQNILKRGREYELDMSEEYLEMIENAYMDFLKSISQERLLVIECDGLDFVGKDEDYRHVMNLIADKISGLKV